VIDETTVAYLDLTGSGIESVAHIRENGRIVVMFCAFQGPPKILRLHGHGRVVELRDAEFASLKNLFPEFESAGAIIVVQAASLGVVRFWRAPAEDRRRTRPPNLLGRERKDLMGWHNTAPRRIASVWTARRGPATPAKLAG
jgi:hypothetical protein